MNLLSLIIYEYEIQIANQSLECIAKFRYLTIQNYIQSEIKSRLNSGTDCCHVIKYLLSTFISTNVGIKVCRTAFFSVAVYVCTTHRQQQTHLLLR
jgi:hypothetical protein